MALGDSGRSRTATSYESGDNLLIRIPGVEANQRQARMTLDVTMPTKAVVNARPVMSGDSPRWYFDQTLAEGVYRWQSTDGKFSGMFAVNPPAEEVDLFPADAQELAREAGTAQGAAGGRTPIVAATAEELLAQLDKRSEGTTLTPGVLGMVMILAVLEALMANRYRPAGPAGTTGEQRAASGEEARAAA